MGSDKMIKVLALIIGAEACLVMAGWIFGIDSLTRILPGGINMKFPTAFSFFLSALGLYFIYRRSRYNCEYSWVTLPAIAMTILLVMGAILVSYLTGGFTGIENLFVIMDAPIYSQGSGLPALNTIASFILFGLACLFSLFPDPNIQNKLKFFSFSIFIISFIAVIGYAFGLPVLYFKFNDAVPMALNTALSFILLGWGLVIISKIKKPRDES